MTAMKHEKNNSISFGPLLLNWSVDDVPRHKIVVIPLVLGGQRSSTEAGTLCIPAAPQ